MRIFKAMKRLFFLLLFDIISDVSCICFTITPHEVVAGTAGTITMKCVVNESDVKKVHTIKIKRQAVQENETDVELASFSGFVAKLDDQLRNTKDFRVTGNISIDMPYLTLTMNTQKVVCSDAGTYMCEVAYDRSKIDRIQTQEKNDTLTACANSGNVSSGVVTEFETAVLIVVGSFVILNVL